MSTRTPTRPLTGANRGLLFGSLMSLFLAFLVLQFKGALLPPGVPQEAWGRAASAFGIALGVSGAGGVLLLYLRGVVRLKFLDPFISLEEGSPGGSANVEARLLRQRLVKLSDEVEKLRVIGPETGRTTTEIAQALLPSIEPHLAEMLEAKYAEDAVAARVGKDIASQFDAAIARLQFELGAQTRRSNLNLVIGVLTTLIAVGLLVYMVFGPAPNFSAWTSIASHYIPRVTTVTFIEIFSFFFLRLYRSTLEELRTYHHDVTRLTLQRVAVEAAWTSSDAGAKTMLAKEVLAVSKPVSFRTSEKGAVPEYKLAEVVLKAVAKELASTSEKSRNAVGKENTGDADD